MALWDLAAKAAGAPLYEVPRRGALILRSIPIKFSIGLREPGDAADIAAEKVRQGFSAVKVKVGPDAGRDFARVAAVREASAPRPSSPSM